MANAKLPMGDSVLLPGSSLEFGGYSSLTWENSMLFWTIFYEDFQVCADNGCSAKSGMDHLNSFSVLLQIFNFSICLCQTWLIRSHAWEISPFVRTVGCVCMRYTLSQFHWVYLSSKFPGTDLHFRPPSSKSHALAPVLPSFQAFCGTEGVQRYASSKPSKGCAKVIDTWNSHVFYSHLICLISGGNPL